MPLELDEWTTGRRRGAPPLAFLLALAAASIQPAPASAQSGGPSSTTSPAASPAFLPRAGFHFEWASLITTDRRFDWQAGVGFDVDVVQRGAWRGRLQGRYDAVLGRERRRYDLNHGDYTFDISAGRRLDPATEMSIRGTHVSRHLVDRENQPAISWNTVGARLAHARTAGASAITAEIGLDRAMQQAYVDYAWLADARITWQRPAGGRAAVYADAIGAVRTIDRALGDRDRICGGRIEAGLRIPGRAASLEIFAGYERRMDAYPTDRFRVRMFTIGARLR